MALAGHLPPTPRLIFGVIPRWLAIVVVLIVVLFVAGNCVGRLVGHGPSTANGFGPHSPHGILSLFYRPTPVAPSALTAAGDCSLSGSVISVGTLACSILVAGSDPGTARSLRVHVDAGASVVLKAHGTSDQHSPDTNGIVEVGFADKPVQIDVSCPAACQLSVKR